MPLALAALKDRQVNSKALECLLELGRPGARRSRRGTGKTNHRPISGGRDPGLGQVARSRRGQIAEIQGATGTLVCWEVAGPFGGDVPLWSGGFTDRTLFGKRRRRACCAAIGRGRVAGAGVVRVAEQTAVEFLASGSGRLDVWLNGKSVFRATKRSAFRIDSDRFAATLAAGDNRLVVMVVPAGGRGGISCAVSPQERDGGA